MVKVIFDNVKLIVGIVEVDKDLIVVKNKVDVIMVKVIKFVKS